jgi:hypothetical protein
MHTLSGFLICYTCLSWRIPIRRLALRTNLRFFFFSRHPYVPATLTFPRLNGNFAQSSFSSSVTQDSLLVATEAVINTGETFGVSDSQGNSWTEDLELVTGTDTVEIWHAVASSTGSDTVTFTTSDTSNPTYGFIMDFSGYWSLDTTSSGGATSGSSHPSVSSFTPTSYDLVVAVAADQNSGGWRAGQYYTMVGGNTGWETATEYSLYWSHGSTTAPWNNGVAPWAEAAGAYFI